MCKLEFQNEMIEVSEGKKLYCILEHEFYMAKRAAQDTFIENYKKCGNLKNLIDHLFEMVYKMEDSAEDMIYNFVDKYTGEIWTLDDTTAKELSKYTKNLFEPVWEQLVVKRAELLGHKDNLKEYRRIRKENRTRRSDIDIHGWTLHTARNAIGNAGTSIATSMAESDIFNDETIRSQLLELVGKTYLVYQSAMYDYLEEREEIEFEQIGRAEFLKAQKFLEKAKMCRINSSENIHFLKNAIETCPDIQEIYEYIIENYGDSDLRIEKYALEFMIDVSGWKIDIVKDLLEKNKVTDLSSEPKILAAIDAAENDCRYFGVQSEKFDYVEELKLTWEKIDKILRTVEGVEYPSREEADNIKADIRYLENYSIEKDMLFSAQIDEGKETLIIRLKSEVVKETLNDRLLKLRSNQDILNIQSASTEIVKRIPSYEKNKKSFLFGHIFSQKKRFERFKEVLANNEKIAFVYDTARFNKGKNGLLLTNKKLYYYTENDILAVSLDEFAGIEISQEKIKIHRKEVGELCTDLKINIDQLEYGLFCEVFEHAVMMCRAIKNGDQEVPDEKVYDNFIKKDTTHKPLCKKKKIAFLITAITILLFAIIGFSFGQRREIVRDKQPEEMESNVAVESDEMNVENVEEKEAIVPSLNSNELIGLVKGSRPVLFSEAPTYGEAFEWFFTDAMWSVEADEFGRERVIFTGGCLLGEKNVVVTVYFNYDVSANVVDIAEFWIDSIKYTTGDVEELLQVIYEGYNETTEKVLDNSGNNDYITWINTYDRINGPAASIFIWDANEEGIWFAAGIGASGPAAYIDMRDKHGVWEDKNRVVYSDDTGYILTMDMQDDGSLIISESQEYYDGALSLEGIYCKEEMVDLSICEYVFPNSAEESLSFEDCAGLSELECKIARNEIYARHGRKFNDESLQAYFDVCSWYNGIMEPEEFTENMLNDMELENLQIINEYETAMGYRD